MYLFNDHTLGPPIIPRGRRLSVTEDGETRKNGECCLDIVFFMLFNEFQWCFFFSYRFKIRFAWWFYSKVMQRVLSYDLRMRYFIWGSCSCRVTVCCSQHFLVWKDFLSSFAYYTYWIYLDWLVKFLREILMILYSINLRFHAWLILNALFGQ